MVKRSANGSCWAAALVADRQGIREANTKSLLCWQRARVSPSFSKCEPILYAFQSEGEMRNRSLEELREVCSQEESCLSLCGCVTVYYMHMHISEAMQVQVSPAVKEAD